MGSYQVTVTVLSQGGILTDHVFNIAASSLENANTAAALFMTSYQALVAVQVVSLKVSGAAVSFSQLRQSPSGVSQNRMFLTFKTALDSETGRRYRVQMALSDPLPTVVAFLTGQSDDEPSEWTDFWEDATALLCHNSGTLIDTLTKVSYTENYRTVDEALYAKLNRPHPRERTMRLHSSNHLDNGLDPIHYQESIYLFVGEHRFGAVGYVTLGIFDCAGLLASGTSGISRSISLRKWTSGDVLCRIWYVTNTTSGGNVKLQLRSACRANNGAQTAEDTLTFTFQMGAGSQLHYVDAFTIPEASCAKGDILTYYLERLGNDASDTETQQFPICGVEWIFLADLPH